MKIKLIISLSILTIASVFPLTAYLETNSSYQAQDAELKESMIKLLGVLEYNDGSFKPSPELGATYLKEIFEQDGINNKGCNVAYIERLGDEKILFSSVPPYQNTQPPIRFKIQPEFGFETNPLSSENRKIKPEGDQIKETCNVNIQGFQYNHDNRTEKYHVIVAKDLITN